MVHNSLAREHYLQLLDRHGRRGERAIRTGESTTDQAIDLGGISNEKLFAVLEMLGAPPSTLPD